MDYNADIPSSINPPLVSMIRATRRDGTNSSEPTSTRRSFRRGTSEKAIKTRTQIARDERMRRRVGFLKPRSRRRRPRKIREAEQSSKRRALVLPAPQVSEGELEEIVKMGMVGERANTMARESENEATRGLVGDYAALNTNAPIRTPMAPAQEDHIANEIRNIRALTQTQSSLLGEENTPLREGTSSTGIRVGGTAQAGHGHPESTRYSLPQRTKRRCYAPSPRPDSLTYASR